MGEEETRQNAGFAYGNGGITIKQYYVTCSKNYYFAAKSLSLRMFWQKNLLNLIHLLTEHDTCSNFS